MNRRLASGVIGAAGLLLSSAALQAASEIQQVTIRATSGVPDEIIEYVARISEPDYLKIPPGEILDTFIAKRCGAVTNVFKKVVFEINRQDLVTASINSERSIKMPACLTWRTYRRDETQKQLGGVSVKILPQETLEAVLRRKIGLGPDDKLTCSPTTELKSRCNKTFRELAQQYNPGRVLDPLDEKKELVLPLLTEPRTFRINRVQVTQGLTAAQVSAKITELAQQTGTSAAIIRNTVAPEIRLLGAVSADDLDTDRKECREANKQAVRPWPYDVNAVAESLKRSLQASKKLGGRRNNHIVTAIVDTGVNPQTFPQEFLSRNVGTTGRGRFGLGIYQDDALAPYPNYDAEWHGTQVANIFSGGSGLRDTFPDLPDLVKINIVNLVEIKNQVGGSAVYSITSGGVARGLNHAIENAQVANMSIGSETELTFAEQVLKQKDLVLVVAAGNEKSPLGPENPPLYPAKYGGLNQQAGSRVITVAAHDALGKIAEFSNWNSHFVDLAAPGCAIPHTPGPDGELLYGTSFAAPLVSMTTALMMVFDVPPSDVKLRLWASSDYDPMLVSSVVWSSRLNIPKAVALYDDVLETRSSSALRYFDWNPGDNYVELCAGESGNTLERIKKVTSLAEKPPYSIRLLLLDQGTLVPKVCAPTGDGLIHFEANGNRADIPWSDFLDLIPRHHRPQ